MERGEYVILEHDPTPAAERGAGSALGMHWDFMLTQPDQAALATWRLAANPLATRTPIVAQRIGDHRRDFLTYEGELTRDRGRVRRVDHGTYLRDGAGEIELTSPAGRRCYRWEVCASGLWLVHAGAR